MGMILLMISYNEKPIATGSIIKRCNFNEIGQNIKGKLHSQNLGDNWQMERDTDWAESKVFCDCINET